MPAKWTFEMDAARAFFWRDLQRAGSVIVPYAGKTRFDAETRKKCCFVDVDESLPDLDFVGKCQEVLPKLAEKGARYNMALIDPPFSEYMSNHWYTSTERQNDVARAKDLVEKVLSDDAVVFTFGFSTTGMGASRGFTKTHLRIINHGGNHWDTHCLREIRTNSTLVKFL